MYLHKIENELNSLEYIYTRQYVQIIHMLRTDWMPALDIVIDNKQESIQCLNVDALLESHNTLNFLWKFIFLYIQQK